MEIAVRKMCLYFAETIQKLLMPGHMGHLPGMDTGQIIAQCEVEVLADDTEASLASRVKEFEHKLYPLVIDAIASGDFSDLPGN